MLAAGRVPDKGLRHIQVDRDNEVQVVLDDLAHVAQGGGRFRFVMGEHGVGKTFFMNLAREVALDERFVVTHGELSGARLLASPTGKTQDLCFDLMRNLATRSHAEGDALASIVERFISGVVEDARCHGFSAEFMLHERLDDMGDLPCGNEFSQAILAYWRGHTQGNEQLQADALRWLHAGFPSGAEAKRALGIHAASHEGNLRDYMALWSRFAQKAGFAGFMVCLDDFTHLYNLPDPAERHTNYEEILRMLVNTSQGTAGLYLLISGAPDVFMDTQHGLFSSPQLRSYLTENGMRLSGSFLQLHGLGSEELLLFFRTIRDLFMEARSLTGILPDEGIQVFMQGFPSEPVDSACASLRGAIVRFVHLLLLLEKNPKVPWKRLLSSIKIDPTCIGHPPFLPEWR
jgi:hypothetical protein